MFDPVEFVVILYEHTVSSKYPSRRFHVVERRSSLQGAHDSFVKTGVQVDSLVIV